MTHPDILYMEQHGYMNEPEDEEDVDRCEYCGEDIERDSKETVESSDWLFCSMECCCAYYGIRRIIEQ